MKERYYLTAIEIDRGLITLIEDDGSIGYYLQRGIKHLSNEEKRQLIVNNKLIKDFANYKELPLNYSISFEDTEIMGRALATHPYVLWKMRKRKNSKQ